MSNLSKLNDALKKAFLAKALPQYTSLISNTNVQTFASELASYNSLRENTVKAINKLTSLEGVDSTKVAAFLHKLDCSSAFKTSQEFFDIISNQGNIIYHPYFMLTCKQYTKYLSTLALVSTNPKEVTNVFTANGTINNGSKLVDLVDQLSVALVDEPEKVTKLIFDIEQFIFELELALDKVSYYVSVMIPSFDLLVSGTLSKLSSEKLNISMFMSPLLNIIVKGQNLTNDALFLDKGIFSANISPAEVASIYDQAMVVWLAMFKEVGLYNMLTYFDDSYFTIQFVPTLINTLGSKYLALFDKSIKASYDVDGFLPEYQCTKEFVGYITHSATVGKADLGILGVHDIVHVDIGAIQAVWNEFSPLFNPKERAVLKGELVVSEYKQYNLNTGVKETVTVENYNCSVEQQRKYGAELLSSNALNIVKHLAVSQHTTLGRYMDKTGRVYYKSAHDCFSLSNKTVRELLRVSHNVNNQSYYINFDSEFNFKGELIWLDWNGKDIPTEEMLDKLFGSVSYQFFASFYAVLGHKITDIYATKLVFSAVQDFFAPILGDKSLADKSTYTKETATSLWLGLKGLLQNFEYDSEVYVEATKFLKVMFGELPYGRCSFTVAYDATSSVTQLISLYCGEVSLMEGSNVIPSKDCRGAKDVYISITEDFLKAKPEILKKDLNEAELVNELKANRSIIKYAWMTYIYGSPVDFINAYGEEGLAKFEDFLANKYPRFAHYIKVFQNLWNNPNKYTFVGRNRMFGRNVDYNATMPDGFEFNYTPVKSVDVYCPSFLKLKVTYPQVGYDLYNRNTVYKDSKNRKASDRSFSANITHSVDSLIARDVILACEYLPLMHTHITSGFLEAVSTCPEFSGVFSGIVSFLTSKGCSVVNPNMPKDVAKNLYYTVRADRALFDKCKYIVANQDKLFEVLQESRFVSSLWLIPFAGIALKQCASIIGKECAVFDELATVAYKLMDLIKQFIYKAGTLSEDSEENPLYLVNQLFTTLSLLPSEKIALITIHDSFHVLPIYSKTLHNIVRLQYAKYAESDLYEHILASFFGKDFVSVEGMNFLTQKEKAEISSKVFEAPFVVTF